LFSVALDERFILMFCNWTSEMYAEGWGFVSYTRFSTPLPKFLINTNGKAQVKFIDRAQSD
jgi:hypothetical protein